MNPFDINNLLQRNNLSNSCKNTPIKTKKSSLKADLLDSSSNMKMLLKNKSLFSQHKDFIKKKIKNKEVHSISLNSKNLDKEKNISTSKISRNANRNSPETESKGFFPSEESKNQKKINTLLDIIKKKDYEIEKLQRLVRNKSEYIQNIEKKIKSQNKEKSQNYTEAHEKLEFLRQKNLDIVQKAEEIHNKLENFQTPNIRKQNLQTIFPKEPPLEIYELEMRIKTLERNLRKKEVEKTDLSLFCARLAADCQNYMNATNVLKSEQKIMNFSNRYE